MEYKVQEDGDGLYVEVEGVRYRGDLPPEGTLVEASTYTAVGDELEGYATWPDETPSGEGLCRLTSGRMF